MHGWTNCYVRIHRHARAAVPHRIQHRALRARSWHKPPRRWDAMDFMCNLTIVVTDTYKYVDSIK